VIGSFVGTVGKKGRDGNSRNFLDMKQDEAELAPSPVGRVERAHGGLDLVEGRSRAKAEAQGQGFELAPRERRDLAAVGVVPGDENASLAPGLKV
jgi:hypothetical protein